MTVINNIEIDNIQYTRNVIKEAIINNEPIDSKLHVVITISNPCLYARRYILLKEFINRMELEETDVIVYVVELVYKKQKYIVTQPNNKRHLQIRTETPIWHKENMTNLGVQQLLPPNWKAMAWIDSDVEFENPSWAMDTLKVLNGTKDIVQVFSHCVDMNQHEETMHIFTSFGHQYVKKRQYTKKPNNFWHPGYGWACTRKAYEKMGGLYDKAILGSGDNIMALCLIQQGLMGINEESTEDYKESVLDFQNRVKLLRLGYVPGVIRHHFHGSKKNRNYGERWKILLNYDYEPSEHVTYADNGVLVPTDSCPKEMLDEIFGYFKERNEDEFYQIPEPENEKEKEVELKPIEEVDEDEDEDEYDQYSYNPEDILLNEMYLTDDEEEEEDEIEELRPENFVKSLWKSACKFMDSGRGTL